MDAQDGVLVVCRVCPKSHEIVLNCGQNHSIESISNMQSTLYECLIRQTTLDWGLIGVIHDWELGIWVMWIGWHAVDKICPKFHKKNGFTVAQITTLNPPASFNHGMDVKDWVAVDKIMIGSLLVLHIAIASLQVIIEIKVKVGLGVMNNGFTVAK